MNPVRTGNVKEIVKKKNTTSKTIFFLSLIGLLAACQAGTTTPTKTIPTPNLASIKTAAVETASAELALTIAPTPPSTPIPPTPPTPSLIVFSPGEAPSFITARGSLPTTPGDYLLYDDPLTHGLGYVSMDGTLRGTLLQYKNIGRSGSFSPDLFVTSSTESPKLIFTDKENGEINIWITDLIGNLLKSLHAKVNFDARKDCYWSQPIFSDDSRWLALWCGPENERLLYFLDLNLSNEKITLQGLDYCGTEYNDVKSSVPYDEAAWRWWCDKEPEEYCFISRFENKSVCVVTSWTFSSPDLSKAVVIEGNMPHNSDETVPGIRIVVFDRACLLKESPCGMSQEFELPYYQPISVEKLATPALEFQWDEDGKSLAWLLAPFGTFGDLNTRGTGPASSGIINLAENTNQILWQELPANTHLSSKSPDGEWLLFSDQKGLYIGSIKQQNIRRLVAAQNYGATFYGWLTIP